MKALVVQDLVVGKAFGDVDGIDIPKNLQNKDVSYLRFYNDKVVDVSENTSFYIDQSGQKHVVQLDVKWKNLLCRVDDELVKGQDGNWKIKSDDDVITEEWNKIREKRNRLLAESDWTQLEDAQVPLDQKHAWKNYRQALRDITKNFEKAENVIWPKRPK